VLNRQTKRGFPARAVALEAAELAEERRVRGEKIDAVRERSGAVCDRFRQGVNAVRANNALLAGSQPRRNEPEFDPIIDSVYEEERSNGATDGGDENASANQKEPNTQYTHTTVALPAHKYIAAKERFKRGVNAVRASNALVNGGAKSRSRRQREKGEAGSATLHPFEVPAAADVAAGSGQGERACVILAADSRGDEFREKKLRERRKGQDKEPEVVIALP
jgi:hypothetical protein